MINQNLTNYIADKYNYQVSDDYVNELIRDNPSFQTDGEFDQAVYQAITASRGRNGAALFRNELKTNARAQQVVSGYGESALVLPSEVRALLEMQTEKSVLRARLYLQALGVLFELMMDMDLVIRAFLPHSYCTRVS